MLRTILASQQPDRCKQAQVFISTQGLKPDTVAELVAEEVTRELLTPSEGTGALPSRPPLTSQTPFSGSQHLRIWMYAHWQFVRLTVLYCFITMFRVALPLSELKKFFPIR
jgi:hypothetical protein